MSSRRVRVIVGALRENHKCMHGWKWDKTFHKKSHFKLWEGIKKQVQFGFFHKKIIWNTFWIFPWLAKRVLHIVWALFKNEIGSNSEKRVLKTCPSPVVFDYFKKVKNKMKSQCSHCADLSCDSIAKSSTWLQLFIKFIKQTLSITQGLSIHTSTGVKLRI